MTQATPQKPLESQQPVKAKQPEKSAKQASDSSDNPVVDDQRHDAELVSALLEGDYHAFEVLYQRYQRPIMAFVYQMVNDYHDSCNIVQEVFLKLYERGDRYDPSRKFSPWLYAVARNATIDYCKRRRGKLTMLEPELASDLANEQEPPPVQLDHIEHDEAITALKQAIQELPPDYRAIVELVSFQGMSYEEASEALGGVSLGTLRSRMYHAIRRLRKVLGDLGGETGENLI